VDYGELGHRLFGRSCRLTLALWILKHESDRFFQSQPPKSIISQSAVGSELNRLVELGMLTIVPNDGGRRVYYQRTQSPLWTIIEAARNAVPKV
jgi:hypothetical protein